MKSSVRQVQVDAEHAGVRLDKFLQKQLPGVPFSVIQRIMRSGQVRVNGGRAKGNRRLEEGETVRIPPVRLEPKGEGKRVPQDAISRIGARIIYQDDWILAINKPAGMPVHGGSGHAWGAVDALQAYLRQQGVSEERAGEAELVHRLDKDTSGVLLFGLRPRAVRRLAESMRDNQLDKRYLALVKGAPEPKRGEVNQPLSKGKLQGGERMVVVEQGGQEARTRYMVKRQWSHDEIDASMVELQLLTGRTHQIRVHMAWLGHPLAGDYKYGEKGFNQQMKSLGWNRLFLHASRLTLRHPSHGHSVELHAPLDEPLSDWLKALDGKDRS
uniref:Pseudouridine synthase n=1 Tax=Magnetococcus massalia (strain MO-1) TaxID=451514 RepID=A0A1S7LHW8_MAGMO|nr:Ribosomal large subunit pseudouridine synthase C [Candidatus Magnetococcus massalia]